MTKITLTRHYSGFQNVADRYSIGNNERAGNAASSAWLLPDGYKVDGNVIRDHSGYECEIVPHESGRPQIISKAGPVSATPLLKKAD